LVIALGGALACAGSSAALTGGAAAKSKPSREQQGRKHRRASGLDRYGNTATPIKHVIVIIGENHTFDNVFGTYRPPAGQTVKNLLSEGIVTTSGAPGPQVSKATQQTATDTTRYQIDPRDTGAYQTLPQPNTTSVSPACDGQSAGTPDARFPGNLPNAPYQITKYVPYFDSHGQYASAGTCEFIGAFVGDPLHRFYQMYQEVSNNKNDLWTWVHETAGDSNGDPAPSPFTDQSTHQGALDMGFYNMASGDAPVLDYLARHYSMSDNYHQAVMGGTGANHIMLGTGDAAFYQDGSGNPTPPRLGEIENPKPAAGDQQLLHPGWVRQRRHHQWRELLELLRPHGARRERRVRLPGQPRIQAVSQRRLRPEPLLPAQRLQPRVQRRRVAQHLLYVHGPAAAFAADDRRCPVSSPHQLGLLRRGL
jgi:hypothetical protein